MSKQITIENSEDTPEGMVAWVEKHCRIKAKWAVAGLFTDYLFLARATRSIAKRDRFLQFVESIYLAASDDAKHCIERMVEQFFVGQEQADAEAWAELLNSRIGADAVERCFPECRVA